MKKHRILLRKAIDADSNNVWKWRNHPKARINCFNSSIIPLVEHKKWFHSKIGDNSARIYIAQYGKYKVGIIRFEVKEKFISVSVQVNPAFLGNGFGAKIVKIGSKGIFSELGNTKPLRAEIKKDNIASQKVFIKAGYRHMRSSKRGLIYGIGIKNGHKSK